MIPTHLTQTFLLWAAFFGFTGVALGAFGAHGLTAHFEANPSLESSFDTAVQYQLIHAVALLGVAFIAAITPARGFESGLLPPSQRPPVAPSRWARFAGWLFVAGIILFSGALYLLSIYDIRFMGAVAPIGGLALLGGWLCVGLAARGIKPN
jgi:uncharacterized membrane protein YgdD (TMEM256/DUF423 family)